MRDAGAAQLILAAIALGATSIVAVTGRVNGVALIAVGAVAGVLAISWRTRPDRPVTPLDVLGPDDGCPADHSEALLDGAEPHQED